MHAAALFLFAIQCLDGDPRVDARIERRTDFALVKVAKPRRGAMTRHRAGDVTLYTAVLIEEHIRDLRLYAGRGDEWWQLLERGGDPTIDGRAGEPAEPVHVRQEGALIAVTYNDRSFHGETAKTLLLDFRPATPRVQLLVECGSMWARGACTAPSVARQPRRQLACDASLRCTSTETQWVDWTTRTATRTFDLLTDETVPPKRFGTVAYRSGRAYAQAFARGRKVLAQRAVIDRIGPVTPLFELSPDSILFAAPAKDPRVAVRFFHLTPGKWRDITVMRLLDRRESDDAPRPLDQDHTPDAPQLLFFAWNIEYKGKGRLIEVVVREGEARSLYWIMFDPNGRTGAIRLAIDTPEFRDCDDRLYPLSVVRLEIPDAGLPAYIGAIRSWRLSERKTLLKHCGLVGRLGWSSSEGWQPTLFEAPCAKPWPQPFVTVLDDEGTLGFDFARPDGECASSP
jgi:hypothetical protein